MSTELNKGKQMLRQKVSETDHPQFLATVNLFFKLCSLLMVVLGQVSKQLAEIYGEKLVDLRGCSSKLLHFDKWQK